MTLDILIPTYGRACGLAVTLTSIAAQSEQNYRVVISDQTEYGDVGESGEVRAVVRLLRAKGHKVEIHKHLPRRGLAEQREFLFRLGRAEFLLFLDDDVILEPDVVARLLDALRRERCGFVGSAVIGLSYINDVRPQEQAIEFWDGPVTPERVTFESSTWARHQLHNAANLYHVQSSLNLTAQSSRLYKVAWVGGCVLYRAEALRAVGGFSFWQDLPPDHCGEDVLAQQRVMARFGGCGLIPSGVYHQELPTTVRTRALDAAKLLPVADETSPPNPAVASG